MCERPKRPDYASIPSFPKSQQWRTPDDCPLCFHYGKPGYVVRYCRERRLAFTDARTRREPRWPTTLGDYMPDIDEKDLRIPPTHQPRNNSPYLGRGRPSGRRSSRSPAQRNSRSFSRGKEGN
ncbi:hypothetical protein LAZ67_21001374 [Cordylochernes scorpioides]|uniref:CCHC-type domain-containing protein n=1 Tax=Cordylochernes scorpioides TaxID=51811 RepID=A0ABY6LPD0_9ARAC|nr:hypothetical protein LAZ67_21001374 [Cordylochernes scorpioides]